MRLHALTLSALRWFQFRQFISQFSLVGEWDTLHSHTQILFRYQGKLTKLNLEFIKVLMRLRQPLVFNELFSQHDAVPVGLGAPGHVQPIQSLFVLYMREKMGANTSATRQQHVSNTLTPHKQHIYLGYGEDDGSQHISDEGPVEFA